MDTLESRCAQAYNDTGIDSSWIWEPPVQKPRPKTHYVWFKPNGQLVLDPWYPKGPLVRQAKPGSTNPSLVTTSNPRQIRTGRKAVPKCNARTHRLQQIAGQLVKAPVKYVEHKVPKDPDEFFHFTDDRIVTSPIVCGEYQVIRSAVQTDRFYEAK